MLIMYQSHCRIKKKKGNKRKWEVKQYVHKWINSFIVCSHWSRWQLLLLLLLSRFSRVRLFATPWTSAYQTPPPMEFSRREYWSRLPLPSPRWQLSIPNFIKSFLNIFDEVSTLKKNLTFYIIKLLTLKWEGTQDPTKRNLLVRGSSRAQNFSLMFSVFSKFFILITWLKLVRVCISIWCLTHELFYSEGSVSTGTYCSVKFNDNNIQ